MLPLDNPLSKTLLVRNCVFQGKSVEGWDVDLVDSNTAIDEELKNGILGARHNLLHVEGGEIALTSLCTASFPRCDGDYQRKPQECGIRRNKHPRVGAVTLDKGTRNCRQRRPICRRCRKTGTGRYLPNRNTLSRVYILRFEVQEEIAKIRSSLTGDDPQPWVEEAKVTSIEAVKSSINT